MTASQANGHVARSIEAMLRNQTPDGAFVASPDFTQYRYCWLRDGSFTAYALDRSGKTEAASRFHSWVAGTLERLAPSIEQAVRTRSEQRKPRPSELPPARFALDGSVVADDWPNFQIDGYGTWLWSLREHVRTVGGASLSPELAATVERVGRYLAAFALDPCFDVWEMSGSEVHTSTLACIYGGLQAAAELLDLPKLARRAEEVRLQVLEAGVEKGRFTKSNENPEIEASTLWLAVPFRVVELDDPLVAATVEAIADKLHLEGGVRRFPSDTYFGGGAWPVLTGSLGWYFAAVGERERAGAALSWIESRFDEEGRLAEQFGGERRDPVMYAHWVEQWGVPARDLVWSHAMHAVLAAALYEDRVGHASQDGRPDPRHRPEPTHGGGVDPMSITGR